MARIHLLPVFIALLLDYVAPDGKFPNQQCQCECESRPRIWVLLVAGHNNYAHESDICRAYHMLRRNGIPEDHIITMMYDYWAYHSSNPYPGQLFNTLNGPDVYQGVRIDYKNVHFNSMNFLAILEGNSSAVTGGNGRVIRSTEKDNIFVFISGIGSNGYFLTYSDIVTAHELTTTLKRMKERRYFNQLAFYLDAGYSASMFDGILPSNIDVYAIAAARSNEDTYLTEQCTDNRRYLATEFPKAWLDDSDAQEPDRETLRDQYEVARAGTHLSHVERYGDLSMENEFVATFQGSPWEWMQPDSPFEDMRLHMLQQKFNKPKKPFNIMIQDQSIQRSGADPAQPTHLHVLQKQLDKHKKPVDIKIQEKRQYLDSVMKELVSKLFNTTGKQQRVLSTPRGPIKHPECHSKILKAFHQKCFNLHENPYAGEYASVLSNICDEGVDIDFVIKKMIDHCQGITVTNIE